MLYILKEEQILTYNSIHHSVHYHLWEKLLCPLYISFVKDNVSLDSVLLMKNAFSIPEPKKPPVFDQHLAPVTASEGDSVQLSCHVQGSEPIRIQWLKAGREVKPSDRCSFSFASGTAMLELKETAKADSGDYVCKASNVAGSDTSKCKVTIKGTDTKKV